MFTRIGKTGRSWEVVASMHPYLSVDAMFVRETLVDVGPDGPMPQDE